MDEMCSYENEYLSIHGGTLYPGLEDTLKELKKNYRLFIVSNCQSGYIEAFLHAHIIRKLKPGNSAPPYPYSHLQRNSYRTRHPPALWRGKKRTALQRQMQHASSANPTRCIGTRNALHLKERFAAVGKKILCSWKRDLVQLRKRFAAIENGMRLNK